MTEEDALIQEFAEAWQAAAEAKRAYLRAERRFDASWKQVQDRADFGTVFSTFLRRYGSPAFGVRDSTVEATTVVVEEEPEHVRQGKGTVG